ncbi:MAG TPA: VOC family protein [Fimbriimonadaceae bacterium]|nr:VOC family protein [Fimbriimonadaceae bacterium]
MPHLDAIGIVVADMGRALAFYQLLGLTFPDGSDGEDHVECMLPNGLRIMFDTIQLVSSFTNWVPPVGNRMALAFRCGSPLEVDSSISNVRAAGHVVVKEPWDAFWGQRYAQVEDPDGNIVDLFADLGA